MRNWPLIIARGLALAALAASVFAVFVAVAMTMGAIHVIDATEDLDHLNSVAVDSHGLIYGEIGDLILERGDSLYHTIEQYDPSGRVLRSWRVRYHGSVRIRVTGDDELQVAGQDPSTQELFDSSGALLQTTPITDAQWNQYPPGGATSYAGRNCDRYEIQDTLLYPRLVEIQPDGRQRLVMNGTVYQQLAISPWVAMMAAGFLAAMAFRGR
jgi:hypothetical protein